MEALAGTVTNRSHTTRFLPLCAAFLALASAAAFAEQATAVLASGRAISGDIISENDKEIQLRTPYGDLTFRKMDLKDLKRAGGTFGAGSTTPGFASPGAGSAFGAPTGDPFGGGAATASPFGGAASAGGDPFGGAATAPSGDPFGSAPAGGDPFGGAATAPADPFGGGASTNPFGAAPAPSAFGGAPSGNPFGVGSAAAPPDPFGGGGASDSPFGGAAAPAPDPFGGGVATANPFGGAPAPNAFGGAPSSNPFGGAAAPDPFGAPTVAAPAAPTTFDAPATSTTPTFDPFGAGGQAAEYVSLSSAPAAQAPPIPFSWDAVLFDFRPEGDATVVVQPGDPETVVTETANLRSGAVLGTGNLPTRLAFKNGRDLARVAPVSKIVIVESTPDSIVVDLRRGALWFDLSADSPARKVVVRTNNARIEATGGGAFRVADALDHGVHVAVVEGAVDVVSTGAQMAVRMQPNKMLLVRPDGAMTQQMALNKVVAQEYQSWDTLAADWWEDMRTMIAATNPVQVEKAINVGDLQKYLKNVTKAFGDFAQDTGHVPAESEGFSVLAQNAGSWDRWEGPYWTGVLPPVDCWGRPMRYKVRKSGDGGRTVGIVYSFGPDQIDNQGDPAADVAELVLYYQMGL